MTIEKTPRKTSTYYSVILSQTIYRIWTQLEWRPVQLPFTVVLLTMPSQGWWAIF